MPKSLKSITQSISLAEKDLLNDIKHELVNVKNNTNNVNVNTDTLEAKIQATNDKLDSFSGDTNNTTTIGDGSTQLRTVPLGYDRANGKAISFLIDSAGHQQIDIVSGGDIKSTLDTLSGAGNNNVGEGQTKLQIFNYGRDTAAGNYKPMKVDGDGRQEVRLVGNTSGDGTGTSNHLHVDSNGIAKTQVVNAPTIIPHGELNSGTNDNPRDSIAVGLRGRQTITDESTETFLLCDSAGHLQIDVNATNYGSNGNLLNNETMNSGNTSTIVDVSAFNHGNLLYEDATTSSTDTLDVEASGNGVKYYKIATLTPALRGSKREGVSVLDLHGITHLQLKNSSSTSFTSVTASIYGGN